ncbi:hypothetical protein [uncultured Parabacteroides sp.]|uniref:hypothetical protein n=1 Tax=uncultured Parabacteroides sp. TaxID=512312 RepID=UPI0025E82F3C|nr:hypothetical protein [uncultured Parabacteroides sp.]
MKTIKSNTLLGLLLYLLFSANPLFAQQPESEQIKSIKNNAEYIYTESEAQSWGDAEDAAKKALLSKATAWLKEKKQIIDPVSIENTVYNADIIELDGDKPRIFCYIHTKELAADFLITEEVVKKEENTNTPSISSNPPIDAEATKNYAQEGFERSFNLKKEEKAEEEKKTEEESAVISKPAENKPVESSSTPEKPATHPQTTVADAAGYPQPIQQIIQCKNSDELNNSLAQLKENNKIIYGTIKSMTAPERSYILVFNNDRQIIAILDKGKTERRNLLTGKTDDRIGNYTGMKAIWFQLFE